MLVAAITRTSTDCSVRPPSRRNVRSCSTRSSFTCVAGRHLADLVEEQRAAVGQLETALPPIGRAGERALLVAEDLALEQRLGNRRAVDRHKRKRRARAELVDRLRDQLLAGARLAGDEHRRARRRRLLDDLVDLPHLRGCCRSSSRTCRARAAAGAAPSPRAASPAARRSCRAGSSGAGCRPAWSGSRRRLPSSPRRRSRPSLAPSAAAS